MRLPEEVSRGVGLKTVKEVQVVPVPVDYGTRSRLPALVQIIIRSRRRIMMQVHADRRDDRKLRATENSKVDSFDLCAQRRRRAATTAPSNSQH
jgi:hypothetical protein